MAAVDANKDAYVALETEFRKYQDAVDSLVDKIKGADVVDNAEKWSQAMRATGDNVSLLLRKSADELGSSMRDAIEAMACNGTLTAEQSSRYTELMLKIDAYSASLKKQTTDINTASVRSPVHPGFVRPGGRRRCRGAMRPPGSRATGGSTATSGPNNKPAAAAKC